MLQIRWKLVPLCGPDFFELLLKLGFENGTIHHVTNASRTSFIVTNLALLLIDLPGRAHSVAPVFRRRRDHEFRHVIESSNAMQTIANHAGFGSELSFVSELLKVAAAATAEIRTRWFNSDRRRCQNFFDRGKQHVSLDTFDSHSKT